MIAVNQIVLIIFRLINFGVLIGLAGFLYKRYGLPIIQEGLAQYRAYFEGLFLTHRRLKKEQQLIENTIINDRKEQDILKERLMCWLASVEDQNKLLILEKEKRKKMLKDRMILQQKKIAEHRLFNTVLSQALIEARQTLAQRSKNEAVQTKMFDSIVSMMRKQ